MTIQPGKLDIKILQGATFHEVLTWEDETGPVAFTGYTAKAQAREEYSTPTAFMNLTTENGGITLGETDGTITLYMDGDDTAEIDECCGVWDLMLYAPNGDEYRLLQGEVCVSKGVTR